MAQRPAALTEPREPTGPGPIRRMTPVRAGLPDSGRCPDLLTRRVGLENSGLADAARAYIQDGGDQLTTDGLDRRTAAQRQGDRVEVATRLERASALSRAIRETLIPDERARIASDPQASARLEALDATCYRIELTRNVHNVDVAGVRALRSARMVKLLRLAGHAPIPEPIDFDDDTRTGGRGY